MNKYLSKAKYIFLVFVFALVSCSTKKNTKMSRAYHNLTAYYNVYFNGKESINNGITRIDQAYTENYADILPIFNYSDPDVNSSASGDMDNAIKKAVKCIKKHSITAKPKRKKNQDKMGESRQKKLQEFYNKKEYCLWIDDAYLLMGKANFYKHDYYPALKSLEMVQRKYPNEESTHPANLWLARVYIEMERYHDAESYLQKLEVQEDLPKKLYNEYRLVLADFYMRQKKYDKGTEHLKYCIEHTKDKTQKARYFYILAQINQKNENNDKASNYFQEVIDLNPDYEISFNAKINRAISFNTDSGNTASIKLELNKMLKDDKNIEYQDQIYYALANLEQKDKNEEKAIDYFKLSCQKSVSNDNQKAMSYLSLADIYFARPDYSLAQAYYDSTMQNLSTIYSDYEKIKKKTDNLTLLVDNLELIHYEDSVQKIAQMPEAERLELIGKIIEEVIAEEKRKKEEMEKLKEQGQGGVYRYGEDNMFGIDDMSTKGKWYFYNPSTLSIGKNEFTKKWGKRKLEDNWRRKNKAQIVEDYEAESEMVLKDSAGNVLTNKDTLYYVLQLPLTDSLIEVSHEKIRNAYFQVGEIYWKNLNDYKEAISKFEELDIKYPNSSHTLTIYYALYQLYQILNNEEKTLEMKNLIIEKFPNSHYAKMLSNPDYIKELLASKNVVERLYAQTYQKYQNNQYNDVLSTFDDVKQKFPNNILMPKFAFLSALSFGYMGDTTHLRSAMEDIVTLYPDSEVKTTAQDILDAIVAQEEYKQKLAEEAAHKLRQIYFYNPDTIHYFVMTFHPGALDLNKAKFELLDHNTDFKKDVELIINIADLSPEMKYFTVLSLENKEEAMSYISTLKQKKSDYLSSLNADDYSLFIISGANYDTFIEDKEVERYIKFFNQNYTE